MTIRTRIIIVLLPAILLLLSLLLYSNFDNGKKTFIKLINDEADEIARSSVMEFDVIFETSQKIAEGIAISIGTLENFSEDDLDKTKEDINLILQETLKKNKNIYGSTASFVPGATPLGTYAPYYFQTPKGLKYVCLANDKYDYPSKDWFVNPIKIKQGVWSQPYFDEDGGDVLMTTYSALITSNDEIIGIATVDISIEDIVKRVKKMSVGGKGYAFILTKEGRFIAHPKLGLLSKKTLWDIAKETNSESIKKFAKMIKSGKDDFEELTDLFKDSPALIRTINIDSTDWTLVIIYPRNEILKPLHKLRDQNMLVSLVIIAFLVILILWLSSTLSSPITKLVEQTKLYSEGSLDKRLEENKGSKEIRDLSKSFNIMGQAITENIEAIKKTTAEKERYAQELQIAAEIQQSILPQKFPPFPDIENRIDLYGITKPAREIGGDYYDFFRIANDRIALVVADVSDKGAPSSFFMAMTRMLVREIATRGMAPAEIMRRTNHMLATDNPHCMFVTLIYAEYNINTGYMRMINAGHNPPLHLHANGKISEISLKRNLPLGIDSGTHYVADEYLLPTGDTLLLYTDGVTEATDLQDKQFGLNRFKEILFTHSVGDSKEIVNNILKEIDEFSSGADQHDDITLMCLKHKLIIGAEKLGQKELPEDTVSLRLPANTNVLEKLACATTSVAKEIGFDDKAINKINLALDEIVTNVIMHAYGENSKENFLVELIPRIDGVFVRVTDYGKPFNFDDKLNAYNSEDASIDQSIGGIGLYLAKQSTDEIWYEPETLEGNRVCFIKYLNKHV
ncbi:MAG: SpoIIE family protein phosphatase [Cyanobacteriota bacterium]